MLIEGESPLQGRDIRSRLVAGAVFCLGLILVVLGGAELFKG
jgi:formate/nitrite transporter FocA (FNT family)